MTTFKTLNETESSEKKPTKFIRALQNSGKMYPAGSIPNEWDEIILLEKTYFGNGNDLIYAKDNDNKGCLFEGEWNDGC